ncbi:MAG: lytic transglycosylase domain-containing protein, partial [Microvirga sp.]
MRPLICLVTSVALVQFSVLTAHAIETPPTTPVPAQPTTLESFVPTPPVPGDLDHLPGIFKAYRDNDLTEAQILKTKLTQPAAHATVEWFAIRSGLTMGLDRI